MRPALTRRHASSGPIPVNSTSPIASGVVTELKNGGPTERSSPVSASEISGKKVPQKITAQRLTSSRLLTRKTDSREASDSTRLRERRSPSREMISAAEPTTITAISASSGPPTLETPKAWIDSRIPERTRNVPSRHIAKVATISETFQVRSIPRFSWTMIECRKAVPSSHGISDAFSTGSQPQ